MGGLSKTIDPTRVQILFFEEFTQYFERRKIKNYKNGEDCHLFVD